jgi:hypothetical protein
LVQDFSGLAGSDPRKKISLITKEERQNLVKTLKGLKLTADSIVGYDQAIVTTGGVSLAEVDPKTMKSKLVDNLYLAGEVLDLDGPTGGYNLQISWSTGYAAGSAAS